MGCLCPLGRMSWTKWMPWVLVGCVPKEDGAETDPLPTPSAQLSSLRSSRKQENGLQPHETGQVGMHSWSPAGFGQPFGSQPTFQPERVTQHIGFPARAGGSLPSSSASRAWPVTSWPWLPSPSLQLEQRGIGHLPRDRGT